MAANDQGFKQIWFAGLFVMVIGTIVALFDGYSIREAVTFGMCAGPGSLAVLGLIGIVISPIVRALGWRKQNDD
jgi:hypothetical protein